MNRGPISEADLHGYVDGALDPARRRELEEYLAAHRQTIAALVKTESARVADSMPPLQGKDSKKHTQIADANPRP